MLGMLYQCYQCDQFIIFSKSNKNLLNRKQIENTHWKMLVNVEGDVLGKKSKQKFTECMKNTKFK